MCNLIYSICVHLFLLIPYFVCVHVCVNGGMVGKYLCLTIIAYFINIYSDINFEYKIRIVYKFIVIEYNSYSEEGNIKEDLYEYMSTNKFLLICCE